MRVKPSFAAIMPFLVGMAVWLALAQAADDILAEPKVESRRFVPLSSAEAVIRYAGDFVPSWAGAISIDLLPAVLVFVLAIAHRSMRREAGAMDAAEMITAAEMMRSVDIYRRMTEQIHAADHAEDPAEDAGETEHRTEPAPPVLRPVPGSKGDADGAKGTG